MRTFDSKQQTKILFWQLTDVLLKDPFYSVHFIRAQTSVGDSTYSALIGQRAQIYLLIFAWLFVAGNRILRLRWYVGSFHCTECRNEAMNRTEYLQWSTAYETQGNMEAICHAPLLHYFHQSVSHMWKCSTTAWHIPLFRKEYNSACHHTYVPVHSQSLIPER